MDKIKKPLIKIFHLAFFLLVVNLFLIAGCSKVNLSNDIPINTEDSHEATEDSEPEKPFKTPEMSKENFYIMTAYDNAPIGCQYGTVHAGKMDKQEMLYKLDEFSGFSFSQADVTGVYLYDDKIIEGIYVEFHFHELQEYPEILEVYYLVGNAVDVPKAVDYYPIKVPEKPGVYNFFVHLKWDIEEIDVVFFRVTVRDE